LTNKYIIFLTHLQIERSELQLLISFCWRLKMKNTSVVILSLWLLKLFDDFVWSLQLLYYSLTLSCN